jgi:hypothetical protein
LKIAKGIRERDVFFITIETINAPVRAKTPICQDAYPPANIPVMMKMSEYRSTT